jgi:hypothetical protein
MQRDPAYHRVMTSWIASLRRNWDTVLAFALFWAAVAIYLGPGWYFALFYIFLCLLIARTALRR